MGMIQTDNVLSPTGDSRAAKSMDSLTCLTIRTGNADCVARFYPALYQLTLVKHGLEEKVDLGFSGSRLLERLARNPGEVVDRDELMNHAWSGRVVGQGSLNQQIYTLRQILADESTREIIQTLPRRGYLINPNFVAISLEESHTTEPATSEPEIVATTADVAPGIATTTAAKPSGKSWLMPTLISLSSVLVLGGTLVYQHLARPHVPGVADKLLTITYAPQQPAELASLMTHGEKIESHFADNLNAPLHLIVGAREDLLNLICLRTDGSARSLHFAVHQLEQLTADDFTPCLR